MPKSARERRQPDRSSSLVAPASANTPASSRRATSRSTETVGIRKIPEKPVMSGGRRATGAKQRILALFFLTIGGSPRTIRKPEQFTFALAVLLIGECHVRRPDRT